MIAQAVARALGGAFRSGEWWRCRCPAHNSRSSSLALREGRSGLIVKCWGGCSWREVLAELQRLNLIDAADKRSALDAQDD